MGRRSSNTAGVMYNLLASTAKPDLLIKQPIRFAGAVESNIRRDIHSVNMLIFDETTTLFKWRHFYDDPKGEFAPNICLKSLSKIITPVFTNGYNNLQTKRNINI
jgi:hypothetical protein